jgi:hypothetical protein
MPRRLPKLNVIIRGLAMLEPNRRPTDDLPPAVAAIVAKMRSNGVSSQEAIAASIPFLIFEAKIKPAHEKISQIFKTLDSRERLATLAWLTAELCAADSDPDAKAQRVHDGVMMLLTGDG